MPGGYKYGTWRPGWGRLESETKCGYESRGTRARQGLRWRGPATVVNDRPILPSEKMLHKDYNRKCSVGEILLIVSRHDELTGGKLPVVKNL
jgi:hypothetical protein